MVEFKKLINFLLWPHVLHFKPDAPDPPDYRGAAIKQGENNIEVARLQAITNNPNVYTPYGSQVVNFNGDQPTITQTLSEGQQGIFDANERIQQSLLDTGQAGLNRVSDAMSTPWDTSGAPQVTDYADMDNSNQVAQALRDRYMPDITERRQQGLDNLLLQGHSRGGQAWNTSSRDFDRTESDFNLAAIVQSESERRANNAQQYGLESANRGRYIQEQAYDRNVPLNEVNSLRTGNQITPYNYQQYQPTNIQPAPMFDATLAAGNFANQNYQNRLGAYGDIWGGIGQLGAAKIGSFDTSSPNTNLAAGDARAYRRRTNT